LKYCQAIEEIRNLKGGDQVMAKKKAAKKVAKKKTAKKKKK